MLRKVLSLGALIAVAVTFGVGNAAAKPGKPPKPGNAPSWAHDGFSDGRMSHGYSDGFSDGRD